MVSICSGHCRVVNRTWAIQSGQTLIGFHIKTKVNITYFKYLQVLFISTCMCRIEYTKRNVFQVQQYINVLCVDVYIHIPVTSYLFSARPACTASIWTTNLSPANNAGSSYKTLKCMMINRGQYWWKIGSNIESSWKGISMLFTLDHLPYR